VVRELPSVHKVGQSSRVLAPVGGRGPESLTPAEATMGVSRPSDIFRGRRPVGTVTEVLKHLHRFSEGSGGKEDDS